MKKVIALLAFGFVLLTNLHAQTYSEKAEMYDTHNYVKQFGDPYNPFIAGAASWFIPGLGQMICNEPSRGLAFLGGYVGCTALFAYGWLEMYESLLDGMSDPNSGEFFNLKGGGKMTLGMIGMAGIGLWSIVDAVHVSKVGNMYYQDHYKRTGAINLKIEPYAEPISMCNQVNVPVGLTLKATF